jgi:hypothetical protein
MWGQTAEGHKHIARAHAVKAQVDEAFIGELAHQLVSYEREFGQDAAAEVLQQWKCYLAQIATERDVRHLVGRYQANRAFHRFSSGDYAGVPASVLSAMWHDSRYLLNRGMMSIMARAVFASPAQRIFTILNMALLPFHVLPLSV